MEHIQINAVSKYFGDLKALDDINISIKQGEFFTLLGPSGCGKTTLLRTLAGFYKQEEGDMFFEKENVTNIPTHQRNIGMVFQNYAIFPHLSVFDNVAYGLKARKVKKEDIKRRVNEALKMVELERLGERQLSQLSGGQQQRVALARAIVIHPGLLLMDEPLSNLDAKLRIKMREDIRDLQKQLDITTIYVTHDQEEALAVSDRIAVLKDGKVQQIGAPHEIYLNPGNKFVANFIGTTNLIEGHVVEQIGSNTIVEVENHQINTVFNVRHEGNILYSIRPEQVKLKNVDENDDSLINGTIQLATFLGESVIYKVQLESGLAIEVRESAVNYFNLRSKGDKVKVDLSPVVAVIFDESGEVVLNEHENNK